MAHPAISVITINLNNGDGLALTIKSVRNQTFTNYEHIIVDGASGDNSVAVIEEAATKGDYGKRLQWSSEKDNGLYNAMNKGIKRARGDYCLFLNSGDFLASDDILQRFYDSHLAENRYTIVSGITKFDNGSFHVPVKERDAVTFWVGGMPHPSSFIKREAFDKFGLYDEGLRIVSDWKFFFQVIVQSDEPYKTVDEIVSVFDTSGISSTNEEICQKERLKTYEEIYSPREMDFIIQSAEYKRELDALKNSRALKLGKFLVAPLKLAKKLLKKILGKA